MSTATDILSVHRHQRRMRRLANALIAFNVLIIIGVTLYPFDFTTEGFRDRLNSMLSPNLTLRGISEDIITNIILFIPLGYAFATLAHRQSSNLLRGLTFVIFTSAAISLSVEILQLYLPFRFSSLVDVASNAAGAGVGYFVKMIIGRRIASHIGEAMSGDDDAKSRFWLIMSYAGYVGFVLLLSVPLHFSLQFADWNYTFPLAVGNEPTGSRPWEGTIGRFAIAYKGIGEENIKKSFAEDSLAVSSRSDLVADYVFSGVPPFIDRSKRLPALIARGSESFPDERRSVTITPHRWLETEKEAYNIRAYLSEKEQFSVFLTVKTKRLSQDNQARIFAVGQDPYHTNIALAQDRDQLCLRLRTMATGLNGSNPMIVVSGVFTDTLMHTIVVTFRERTLHVFKDGAPLAAPFTMGPGLAMFNRFLPSKRKLDITSPFAAINEWLFVLCAFVPPGVILAFIVRTLHIGTFGVTLAALAGLAIPPFAFEHLAMYMVGRQADLNALTLYAALLVTAFVFALAYISRKRRLSVIDDGVPDPVATANPSPK